MKKVVTWVLLPLVLLSLCACGSGASKPLKADDVNSELLCDTWQMDFYIGTDAEGKTCFLKYGLNVTLAEVTENMYAMSFETVKAAYAEGISDNMILQALADAYVDKGGGQVPAISGTAVGLVEDGILTFQMPGFDGAMMHTSFVRMDGVVYGTALENDVNSGYYLSFEMKKGCWEEAQ